MPASDDPPLDPAVNAWIGNLVAENKRLADYADTLEAERDQWRTTATDLLATVAAIRAALAAQEDTDART